VTQIKMGTGRMPIFKKPCYIWCSFSEIQTDPHFALLFLLNYHQPVKQSLQNVRRRPSKAAVMLSQMSQQHLEIRTVPRSQYDL